MYERILIPLDGSKTAESILPFAGQIVGPLDSEIVLLAVVDASPQTGVELAGVVDEKELLRREQEADRYLQEIAERLAAKGVKARHVVHVGPAAQTIVKTAAEVGADLIAMTTHGRTGFGRLLFGSVAEAVLRSSEVPVLLMRTTAAQRSQVAAER